MYHFLRLLFMDKAKKKFKFAGINKTLVNTNLDFDFYKRRSEKKIFKVLHFFFEKMSKNQIYK